MMTMNKSMKFMVIITKLMTKLRMIMVKFMIKWAGGDHVADSPAMSFVFVC